MSVIPLGRLSRGEPIIRGLSEFKDTGEDALPAFLAAIEGLPKENAKLTIPHGCYHVGSGNSARLSFAGFKNLTVEAHGVELRFTSPRSGLAFNDCHNVALHGLTVDWSVPFSIQAIIQAADVEGRWAVIELDQHCAIADHLPLHSIAIRPIGSKTLHWDAVFGTQLIASTPISGEKHRLDFKGPTELRSGQLIVLRLSTSGDHVLNFVRCLGVILTNVTIWAGPSMGLAAGGCADVYLRNLAIVPKPETGRIMSTNADGVHMAGCKGTITIENCAFELMGDDAINVTDLYVRLDVAPDRRSARCRPWRDRKPPRYALPGAGERIAIIDGKTLETWSHATISGVDDAGDWILRFTDTLPQPVPNTVYAIGETNSRKLRVSGCSFKGNRARGVLTHNDAMIDNCIFSDQGLEAILLCPDLWWREGPSVSNVALRGNTISRSGQSFPIKGAITVTAFVGEYPEQHHTTRERVNRNVDIVGNLISLSSAGAIYATATAGLMIRENHFVDVGSAAITLDGVNDVDVSRNACNPTSMISILSVGSTKVHVQDNVGLVISIDKPQLPR